MGTNTGTIMTLANSIIGVSVLAMPFCFKQCGIALSILMLIASSLLSRLACHFLLKSAVMARRRTFEFLAFHTFGPTGKLAVELFIIGFLMGTCIAFFVVMGDLGPAIMAKILGLSNTVSLRPSVLIGLALFVVLPLGMLRNVDSLSSVSMATIGFYICLVLKVVGESLPHLLAGDWYEHVNFWRPAGILQCIPIFSMALFCQTQLFEIYESMHNASLDRMNFVIRAACNICTGVYICVGFFGYIAFCTQPFTGNVLMSFTPSIVSEMIKLGFVLSVAVSFPLVIFPCRASLYSLLFRRITMPHHEGVGSHIPEARFKCLTIFIISVALVIGLLIPNIELVLGLVGSTIGVLICVMFPAAAFICMSTKSSNDRLMAQVLLFVGALILVLGTYATLNSATETKPSEIINKPAAGTVEKSPHFHDKIDNSLADIPPKLEQRPESDVKKFGEEPKKVPELAVEKVSKAEQPEELRADVSQGGKRQEPPVPVEPAGNMKEPTVVSLIKDEKTAIKGVEKEQGKEKIQKEDPEKNVANAEIEKKEIKSAGEQVDQDAIKKEDDELAEAEKRDDNAGNSKNEEILRKLEKHEAQQMKILEEQKQILQALQEHQERELFKEHKEHAAKNSNQTKIVERHEVKVDDLHNQKNQENKEVKDQVQNGYEKPVPPAKKQDLLRKIANGELKKPIVPVPPETIASIKSYQPPERQNKTIPSEKNSFVAEGPVIKIQESLHVAAPNLEMKPEGPVVPAQPLLLERLKGQPLPLTLRHNETKPFISPDSDKKQLQLESGVNAMRREILQESVVGTQTSVIQADVKNASVVLRDILSPQVRGELHDREKRDTEETEPTNIIIDTGVALNNAGQLNISNEETQPQQQENCHITEKSVSGELKHSREMYKKPNKDGDGNAPAMELVNDLLSPSLLPELAKVTPSVNVPQLAINSSQAEETVLGSETPAVANSNYSVPLKSASVSNIENVMIKSVTHLSDPKVKSSENNDVTILRQGVSPDAKPMKRDLKSISLVEDKPTTTQKKKQIKYQSFYPVIVKQK